MPPKPLKRDAFELFQAHFDQLLNPAHKLPQLARRLALNFEGIDWGRFEAALAGGYSPDMGAPAKATRVMVGLQYLKYTFHESDESVVARWVENPYGQSFCGHTHWQHECPIHPTLRRHTLAETLTAVESVSGVAPTDVYVDKGYRWCGYAGATTVHMAGAGYANRSRSERRRRRRCSAIEPKIGHLKSDHRMDGCFLA